MTLIDNIKNAHSDIGTSLAHLKRLNLTQLRKGNKEETIAFLQELQDHNSYIQSSIEDHLREVDSILASFQYPNLVVGEKVLVFDTDGYYDDTYIMDYVNPREALLMNLYSTYMELQYSDFTYTSERPVSYFSLGPREITAMHRGKGSEFQYVYPLTEDPRLVENFTTTNNMGKAIYLINTLRDITEELDKSQPVRYDVGLTKFEDVKHIPAENKVLIKSFHVDISTQQLRIFMDQLVKGEYLSSTGKDLLISEAATAIFGHKMESQDLIDVKERAAQGSTRHQHSLEVADSIRNAVRDELCAGMRHLHTIYTSFESLVAELGLKVSAGLDYKSNISIRVELADYKE